MKQIMDWRIAQKQLIYEQKWSATSACRKLTDQQGYAGWDICCA